jgi:hypothetical protein
VCGSVLEVCVVLCVAVRGCTCVSVWRWGRPPPPHPHLSVPTPPPLRHCHSTCLLSRSKSPGGKSTRPHTGSRCRRGTRVGTRTQGSTRTVQAWLRCCGTAGSSTHPHSRGSRLHRRQRTCPGHTGTGLAQRSLTGEGGRTPPREPATRGKRKPLRWGRLGQPNTIGAHSGVTQWSPTLDRAMKEAQQ